MPPLWGGLFLVLLTSSLCATSGTSLRHHSARSDSDAKEKAAAAKSSADEKEAADKVASDSAAAPDLQKSTSEINTNVCNPELHI